MVKPKKTSTPALKKNPWLVPKGAKLIHESTSKLGFETAVTSQRSMMMMMKFTNTLLPPRTPCNTASGCLKKCFKIQTSNCKKATPHQAAVIPPPDCSRGSTNIVEPNSSKFPGRVWEPWPTF